MGRLENKVAIVSGATGGIGRKTCRLFCEEGAVVFGVDISDNAGNEMQRELTASGFKFEYFHCDVSSSKEIKSLAQLIKAKVSGLDILVNNAGIILGKSFLETTEEEWDQIQNVNLKSVFLMMKELAPLMKGKKGSIINASSIGGVVAYAGMSAYGAAKAGVVMLSKVGAVDFAPDIRVNAICAGAIDTPMPHSFLKDSPDKEAIWRALQDGALLKRLGTPEEIAFLYLYLASDESTFMTGAAISIDGGWSVQ
ncbi:MAG: SDR family oxidoreductase [Betaproteobacteria bacterium]|nr:SDR family oxidoreductase [Betaproteobacteria bacterium]